LPSDAFVDHDHENLATLRLRDNALQQVRAQRRLFPHATKQNKGIVVPVEIDRPYEIVAGEAGLLQLKVVDNVVKLIFAKEAREALRRDHCFKLGDFFVTELTRIDFSRGLLQPLTYAHL
jgi:hypothetical protein